jgi:hypothetical protein
MEAAGDIIQDLCEYLNIKEVESSSHYPKEFQRVKDLSTDIRDYDDMRTHFNANIAENMNNLKVFVVKSEYSLILGDM